MPKQSEKSLREIIKDHSNPDKLVYIETGLWKGEQFRESMKVFQWCYGIELDNHYADKVEESIYPSVTAFIFNDDSAEFLPHLLESHHIIMHRKALFYLDAHFCKVNPPIQNSKLPLWTELKAINERGKEDIVLIDDVHTFGKNRPDLGTDEWKWVTVGNILKVFLDRIKKHKIVGDALVIWLNEKV